MKQAVKIVVSDIIYDITEEDLQDTVFETVDQAQEYLGNFIGTEFSIYTDYETYKSLYLEDDQRIIDLVSDETGWCINSCKIDVIENLPRTFILN